jgi:hypothetical protein
MAYRLPFVHSVNVIQVHTYSQKTPLASPWCATVGNFAPILRPEYIQSFAFFLSYTPPNPYLSLYLSLKNEQFAKIIFVLQPL